MDLQWIDVELERRKMPRRELASRIPGMTETKMSLVMSGKRKLTSEEADNIRRFFGYRLPDDPANSLEDRLNDRISSLDDHQLRAAMLYLEALTGNKPTH